MHLKEVILLHVQQPVYHSGWFVPTERTKSRLEICASVFQYSEIGTTIMSGCEKAAICIQSQQTNSVPSTSLYRQFR